jgi:hypothetical protein
MSSSFVQPYFLECGYQSGVIWVKRAYCSTTLLRATPLSYKRPNFVILVGRVSLLEGFDSSHQFINSPVFPETSTGRRFAVVPTSTTHKTSLTQ